MKDTDQKIRQYRMFLHMTKEFSLPISVAKAHCFTCDTDLTNGAATLRTYAEDALPISGRPCLMFFTEVYIEHACSPLGVFKAALTKKRKSNDYTDDVDRVRRLLHAIMNNRSVPETNLMEVWVGPEINRGNRVYPATMEEILALMQEGARKL